MLLFVDTVDLSTFAALRYARSLRPTTLRAVHFVIDTAQADELRDRWVRFGHEVPLDLIDCPDRRLLRASAELVSGETGAPDTHVTVILPRRSFSPLLGRLLHDRTADKIAAVVSRIPNSAATIIPFDVGSRVRELEERQRAMAAKGSEKGTVRAVPVSPSDPAGPSAPYTSAGSTASSGTSEASRTPGTADPANGHAPAGKAGRSARGQASAAASRKAADGYQRPVPPADVTPIGSIAGPGKAAVEGRIRIVEVRPVERNCVLSFEISDSTGDLTAMFYGRVHIPGIEAGTMIRLRGNVGMRDGRPFMINPAYELLAR